MENRFVLLFEDIVENQELRRRENQNLVIFQGQYYDKEAVVVSAAPGYTHLLGVQDGTAQYIYNRFGYQSLFSLPLDYNHSVSFKYIDVAENILELLLVQTSDYTTELIIDPTKTPSHTKTIQLTKSLEDKIMSYLIMKTDPHSVQKLLFRKDIKPSIIKRT